METTVPPAVADKMAHLKHALAQASDDALSCAGRSVDALEEQGRLARLLHANEPDPPFYSMDDPRYDASVWSYGHGLQVEIRRTRSLGEVLTVEYSMNIECGSDTMLLVYERKGGTWTQTLRWQSPPPKLISDAFGDFFIWAFLDGDSRPDGKHAKWRLAVAHGTPWCTSRFSGFEIDLLSPGSTPASPRVLWRVERGYSRGDFVPSMKAFGNEFELRLNADCMLFDSDKCFERRVIYRYSVDRENRVRRVGPIALNARGFVSEWLRAPWSEARNFSDIDSETMLQEVHDEFDPPMKENDDQFTTHSYGPVVGCAAANVYQVQINSALAKIVPGKPGGTSVPLASRYFEVREVKDGYLVLSSAVQSDPTCSGKNLMQDAER